ncbi:MAG TPA: hypothetical protein PKL77_07055 [Candidatus Omnitrophota bacterium]|nr:hypothetical protein [Candidatus Omnitrophota bacterium]HPT07614.1 hypothetical protein [Candidatus Omnitrophota bacterium]
MKNVLFVWLIVVFTLCGCAHSKHIQQAASPVQQNASLQIAKEALDTVFTTYRSYESKTFERIVSPDFVPDRLLFLGIVDSGFSSGTIIDMQFLIIHATQKNTNLDVVFTWKKEKIPYSQDNKPIMQKGKTQFIFKNTDSKWLLAEVKGDSPF